MTITSMHQAMIEDIVEAIDQLLQGRIEQHEHTDYKSLREGEERAKVDKEVVVKMITDLLVKL